MTGRAQPEPDARANEHALKRLTGHELLALKKRGGWTNRTLAEAAGLAGGSVGNIIRGEDKAGIHALEVLAAALGVPPDEAFTQYRLARARRLFDATEIGVEAADENYQALAAVFPNAARVTERLADAAIADAASLVRQTIHQATERVTGRAQGGSPAEAPRPRSEAPPPAPASKRARRRA